MSSASRSRSTHVLDAACQLGQRDRRGYTRNAEVSDEETDNEPNFSTLGHETSVFEDFDENSVFCSLSAAFRGGFYFVFSDRSTRTPIRENVLLHASVPELKFAK